MANTAVNFYGRIRGIARDFFGAGDQQAALSDGGELVVVQGLPTEAELVKLGLGFSVLGTAIAPVAAIPTTAAHLSLYNGDNSPFAYVIAAIGGVCDTSMAVAGQIAMLARNSLIGSNANPLGAIPIFGQSGKIFSGGGNAKASVALAATDTSIWVPTGADAATVATTTIGLVAHAECYGRWIVPPGGLFSLATLAQTAAGTVRPYIYFYRIPLNMV